MSLTEMMVGKKVSLNIARTDPVNPVEMISVENLTCINEDGIKTLDGVSFTASGGEILGIAGIAGSGQKELLESIAGASKLRGRQQYSLHRGEGRSAAAAYRQNRASD